MKRPRAPPAAQPLGASEFASILNGDDPNAIYRALRRFARTVRWERRLALREAHGSSLGRSDPDDGDVASTDSGADDDDDEGLEEEETVSVAESQKKPKRDEAWKEDSENYNVPFVGTSVSSARDAGSVVVGEWPTGLLKAYLLKSPLAMEVIGDAMISGTSRIHKTLLKTKRGKLSLAIHKACLEAIYEIASVAMPFECDSTRRLVSEVIRRRLSGLFATLCEETRNGKGKAGTRDGYGPLAPLVLRILRRLSFASAETCRQILRSVAVSVPEGVLRFIVKSSGNHETDQDHRLRQETQFETLRWISICMTWQDPVILSLLSSPGARDKKIPPGLLFLMLKELTLVPNRLGPSELGASLIRAMCTLLQALWQYFHDGNPNQQLGEIFSRECVQNLCRLAAYAPKLSDSIVFRSVLSGTDEYPTSAGGLENVGVHARRLLFLLIGNPEKSPLLHSLEDNSQFSVHRSLQLVRAVIVVLDTQKGLEVQKFIIHATSLTPHLFLGIFHHLSLPDSQEVFNYISRLNFLSRMIISGPQIEDCITAGQLDAKNRLERVVSASFPTCLRKNQIQKGLWHNNPLVVASTLQFLFHTLKRIKYFIEQHWSADQVEMKDGLVPLLPDSQTYYSILSRYKLTDDKHNAVIVGFTCSVFEVLMDLFQEEIKFSMTEWTRVLAYNEAVSLNSPTVLLAQGKILSLLKRCSIKPDYCMSRPSFLRDILTIVMKTRSNAILDQAKEVAVKILFQIAAPLAQGIESRTDIDNELHCWIDGMRPDCLDEFCSMLISLQATFQGRIGFSKVWNKRLAATAASDSNVSHVLVAALSQLGRASSSFASLINCVAGRCLEQHSNPIPLAALIVSLEDNMTDVLLPNLLTSLMGYAKVLLNFPTTSTESRMENFKTLAGSIYSHAQNSSLPDLGRHTRGNSLYIHIQEDSATKLRRATHQVTCGIVPPGAIMPKDSIRLLVPLCLKVGWSSPSSAWDKISHAYTDPLTLEMIVKTSRNALVLQHHRWTPYLPLLIASDTGIISNSSMEERAVLFLTHFLAFCMPVSLHLKWVTTLLRRFDASLTSSHLQKFWGSLSIEFLDATLLTNELEDTDSNLCDFGEIAFKVWLRSDDSQLLLRIENIFCRILSCSCDTVSISSCALQGIMNNCGPLMIVERCLAHRQDKSCLLSTLVEIDYTLYGKALLEVIASHRDKKFWLESGRLDGSFQVIFCRAKSKSLYKNVEMIETSLISRGVSVLQQTVFVTQPNPNTLLSALNCVIVQSRNPSLYEAVGEALKTLLDQRSEQIDDRNWELPIAHEQTLALGISLCKVYSENSRQSVHKLSRSIFLYLVRVMSRICSASKRGEVQASLVRSTLRTTVQLLKSFRHETWLREDSIISSLQHSLCRIAEYALARLGEKVRESIFLDSAELFQTIILTDDACFLDRLSPSMNHIFVSLIGHESFRDLITGHANRNKDKHAALTILGLCVCSLKSMDFQETTLELFLRGFNAGVTKCDYLLRALMYEYMRFAPVESPIYLDQLRWTEAVVRDRSIASWDWLSNAVDMKRVQLTVNKFPVDDGAMVNLLTLLKAQGTEKENPHGIDEDPLDQRYSPGFLLTLILSALLEPENDLSLAQRLCERGSIALALASLCSQCSNVRRLALSILGRFTVILQSERARSSPSWRDRPQLLMLIKAVHQALAIKSVEEKWTNGDIRKLPGLSAVFLAKSSFVLLRPSDGLYSFINRFFLRTEEEHGAFQDLYRLPAFVSLFCSIAEDSHEARTERVWALKLICDGFLDSDCYQPLNSCHALELILSGININSKNEQETALALKALRMIVLNGGPRCELHLMKRMGLIYWLRLVLISWPGVTSVSSVKAYLSLLVPVVERTANILQEEAVSGLLGLAEQLLDSPFISRNSLNANDADRTGTLSQCSKIFLVIGQTWRKYHASEEKQLRLDGFNLSNALSFLNMLTNPSDKLQAYCAFCMMPFCSVPGAEDVYQFSRDYLLLLTTAAVKQPGDDVRDMICMTFTRLRNILDACDISMVQRECLLKTLCELQVFCFRAEDTKTVFLSLLMTLKGETELSRALQAVCSYSHI